jgi:ATP-dependent Zn protease
VRLTKGISGADVKNLCNKALTGASSISSTWWINDKDFSAAMRKVKASVVHGVEKNVWSDFEEAILTTVCCVSLNFLEAVYFMEQK